MPFGNSLWVNPHFEDAATLTAEQVESLGQLLEREFVRDELAQVDPLLNDHRHQSSHPFLAAGTERRDDNISSNPSPSSAITPTGSCPRIRPLPTGYSPLTMCTSVPQIV